MKLERIHLVLGLIWFLAGMILGEQMGRSMDHGQLPTHAHIMLVGGVLSVLWAIIYRVFGLSKGILSKIQLVFHHGGATIMIVALYMLYGNIAPIEQIGPVLGFSGLLLMLSVVLMLYLVIKAKD